jgi:hypothetical protein
MPVPVEPGGAPGDAICSGNTFRFTGTAGEVPMLSRQLDESTGYDPTALSASFDNKLHTASAGQKSITTMADAMTAVPKPRAKNKPTQQPITNTL